MVWWCMVSMIKWQFWLQCDIFWQRKEYWQHYFSLETQAWINVFLTRGGGKNLTYSFVTKSIVLKEVEEMLQKRHKAQKLPSKTLFSGKQVEKSWRGGVKWWLILSFSKGRLGKNMKYSLNLQMETQRCLSNKFEKIFTTLNNGRKNNISKMKGGG